MHWSAQLLQLRELPLQLGVGVKEKLKPINKREHASMKAAVMQHFRRRHSSGEAVAPAPGRCTLQGSKPLLSPCLPALGWKHHTAPSVILWLSSTLQI